MIIGLSILAVLLAGLNVWLSWRTFQSQKVNATISQKTRRVLTDTKDLQGRRFGNVNDALQQIKSFQEAELSVIIRWV